MTVLEVRHRDKRVGAKVELARLCKQSSESGKATGVIRFCGIDYADVDVVLEQFIRTVGHRVPRVQAKRFGGIEGLSLPLEVRTVLGMRSDRFDIGAGCGVLLVIDVYKLPYIDRFAWRRNFRGLFDRRSSRKRSPKPCGEVLRLPMYVEHLVKFERLEDREVSGFGEFTN